MDRSDTRYLTRRAFLLGALGAAAATVSACAQPQAGPTAPPGAAPTVPSQPTTAPKEGAAKPAAQATAAPGKPSLPLAGVTLRVFSMTGPFISGPVKAHGPEFEQQFGAKVEAIEAPFAELFPKIQQVALTQAGEFDVLLVSNTWVPDLVNLNYVIPLDPFIEKDREDPLLSWNDVPDGIKLKNSWGGKTYAWIVDNDNQTMFYRKDVLADARWKQEYQQATGKDLPTPPQTLTEFMEVAKFFTGKNWAEGGASGFGFVTSVKRGAQAFWYVYPWAAPYTVVPKENAPAQGIFLFTPDMEPLVNTEGFVRGVTEYVETVHAAMKPGLDTVRADVIEEIIRGTTLMALDWGDIGPASVADRSVVKNKVGFSLSPGAQEYFDWQKRTWVQMPAGSVNRAPTHAFNGWSYYITSTSKNPEAAWTWIKWHSSPQVSGADVASPDSGYQPWRISHSTNLEPWTKAGWDANEAKVYIQTILDATNHPNAVFDPRIPGAARYQEALELHLIRAIGKEVSPQQAMDDCAAEFNRITQELGKDKQIAAYRAHLGMT